MRDLDGNACGVPGDHKEGLQELGSMVATVWETIQLPKPILNTTHVNWAENELLHLEPLTAMSDLHGNAFGVPWEHKQGFQDLGSMVARVWQTLQLPKPILITTHVNWAENMILTPSRTTHCNE